MIRSRVVLLIKWNATYIPVYSSMTRGGKRIFFLTPSPYSASDPYDASDRFRFVLFTQRMLRSSWDLVGINGCIKIAEIRSDSVTL